VTSVVKSSLIAKVRYLIGGVNLEKRFSLLFGIIGGLFLVFLRPPQVNLYLALGDFEGFVTDLITGVLSLIGLIFVVYFSVLLIIDTLKTIHKR
jgi:hypothetical protein